MKLSRKLLVLVVFVTLGFLIVNNRSGIISPIVQVPTPTPRPRVVVMLGDATVDATLSQTSSETSLGLGGVTYLAENEGMLFDFYYTAPPTAFWMKGMLMPIDIIWIKDGKVIQIDANAQPEPDTPDGQLKLYIPDEEGVHYVLEVNAGFAEAKNIAPGASFQIISQE